MLVTGKTRYDLVARVAAVCQARGIIALCHFRKTGAPNAGKQYPASRFSVSPDVTESRVMTETAMQTHPLTSGRLLSRNSTINMAGQAIPLLAGLMSIPIIIGELGVERFGVLTLTWIVIGYFGIFDLGLGRALTKLAADRIGNHRETDIPEVAWTALLLMTAFGIVAAIIVFLTAPWLVESLLSLHGNLQQETLYSFYLLAGSIPLVISTTGLIGLLQAYQRFGLINSIRIPMGVFNFVGPLLVLPFTNSLVAIVGVLVAGRIIAWIIYFRVNLHTIPGLLKKTRTNRAMIKPLFSFGGWMTISNIVGPLLLYADRFLIASLLSVAAVAYYTTPYEVVTKLIIIPASVVGVLFPAFSTAFSVDGARALFLYKQTVKYVSAIMIPAALLIIVFSRQGLTLWLGEEFAEHSFRVAQILTAGCLINGYGLISQSLVQASGRPDLTAKLHLLELPFYATYLWLLTTSHGITGAAAAWFIRVTISALVLAALARQATRKALQHRVATSAETVQ
jgi:O-antigen/teichoic acid export membrane protein